MVSVLIATASIKSLNYKHLFVDFVYCLVDEQKKKTFVKYEIRQQN